MVLSALVVHEAPPIYRIITAFLFGCLVIYVISRLLLKLVDWLLYKYKHKILFEDLNRLCEADMNETISREYFIQEVSKILKEIEELEKQRMLKK